METKLKLAWDVSKSDYSALTWHQSEYPLDGDTTIEVTVWEQGSIAIDLGTENDIVLTIEELSGFIQWLQDVQHDHAIIKPQKGE